MKATSTTPMPLVEGRDRWARRRVEVTDGPAVCPYLTRRDFLRALWLAGVGVVAWVLLRRSCAGNGVCGGCAQYAGCGLPWKEARR